MKKDYLKTFKVIQIRYELLKAIALTNRFYTVKGKNLQLLQQILPMGWKITKAEHQLRYIERTFPCKNEVIYDVFNEMDNEKVRILTYFNETERETTVRLNLVYNELRNEFLIQL